MISNFTSAQRSIKAKHKEVKFKIEIQEKLKEAELEEGTIDTTDSIDLGEG